VNASIRLWVRPIEAADRASLAAAFERLSPESRMQRFMAPKPRLTARELTYLTEIDHVTHEALAAVDARDEIVAVARYAAWSPPQSGAAEVAIAVLDSFQRRGIGTALAEQVIERARENGFVLLTASTSWDNIAARALLARLGFRRAPSADGSVSYRLELDAWACAG
jgi:RimJ/RimL family protein N-acetyltransferase